MSLSRLILISPVFSSPARNFARASGLIIGKVPLSIFFSVILIHLDFGSGEGVKPSADDELWQQKLSILPLGSPNPTEKSWSPLRVAELEISLNHFECFSLKGAELFDYVAFTILNLVG